MRRHVIVGASIALVIAGGQFYTAAADSPQSATVSTFDSYSGGCSSLDVLPLRHQVTDSIPIPVDNSCGVQPPAALGESATNSQSADSTGNVATAVTAMGGSQLVSENAYAFANVSGSVVSPVPTSVIEVLSDFGSKTLAASDFHPAPAQSPLNYPYVPDDYAYVYGYVYGNGPGCVDGSSSASTNSIYLDPSYPAGHYQFQTKIYCPDGSRVDAGQVTVGLQLNAWANSNNGSTQSASGGATLNNATFTFVP